MKIKKGKPQEAHSSDAKKGMGDYYGSGVRAKIGKMRDSTNAGFIPLTEKQKKTPPKSVV